MDPTNTTAPPDPSARPLRLDIGLHPPGSADACLTEAADRYAGGRGNDGNVSPVLAAFGQSVTGGAPFEVEAARAFVLVDWTLRRVMPISLESGGFSEDAGLLRGMPAIDAEIPADADIAKLENIVKLATRAAADLRDLAGIHLTLLRDAPASTRVKDFEAMSRAADGIGICIRDLEDLAFAADRAVAIVRGMPGDDLDDLKIIVIARLVGTAAARAALCPRGREALTSRGVHTHVSDDTITEIIGAIGAACAITEIPR